MSSSSIYLIMSNSDRTTAPPGTPKPSTSARASSPPSRIPPPKLRLKETKPRSLARLVFDLLFPDNSAFVFSEEDEAEFRWYSQHNRDLQERRDQEREAMEDHPALATTSQSAQMGAHPRAEVALQDTYNSPVRRTPREFALASLWCVLWVR